MTRKPTQLGLAPPPQVNLRPSGRYAVQAPDAPVGSILRASTKSGTVIFVEVLAADDRRIFLAADGVPMDIADWDYATRAEVGAFKFSRMVAKYADYADLLGAPRLSHKARNLPLEGRRALLLAVAEELRTRGKTGKAEQVTAYLDLEE